MITNSEFQAALVTRLKDNTKYGIAAIHALLATSGEIRENQFQGADFAYPALRVLVSNLNPIAEGPCRDSLFRSFFSIAVFSESTSSKEADDIAGLVAEALDERMLDTITFRTGNISLWSVNAATRIGPRLWKAEVFFRTSIYQKTPLP